MHKETHYLWFSGYIGSVSFLETVLQVVEKLRSVNPGLVYGNFSHLVLSFFRYTALAAAFIGGLVRARGICYLYVDSQVISALFHFWKLCNKLWKDRSVNPDLVRSSCLRGVREKVRPL
jgi:uncharacterized membrane protein (DUF4010 family)